MKWTVLIVIFTFFSQEISAQNVTCNYENINLIYTCTLFINNLEGFDNFTAIGGTHLAGKTNLDVRRVVSYGNVRSTVIPSIICSLFRFTDLISITNSQVEEVGPNAFRGCGVLTDVRLQNNKITKLSSNAFEANRFLRNLYMEENYIEELPSGFLRNLVSLEFINLSNNYLFLIQTDVFGTHPKLEKIMLNLNFINALTPAIFNQTALKTFEFEYNLCGSGYWYNAPVANMTAKLQRCLDNYEVYQLPSTTLPPPPPGKCGEGNIFDRVCDLEDKSETQELTIQELVRQVYVLTERVNELTSRPSPNNV